jgi:predicted enzyme related to lactoylglutathione lyase
MPRILQNHYVLAVHDLRGLSKFFADLGFEIVSEPPGWIFVAKDNCMIMLGECRDAMRASTLGDHSYFGYLRVDDVDSYFQSLLAKGVTISHPIENKPWGMREFGVMSPEGHRIMIGQSVGERESIQA